MSREAMTSTWLKIPVYQGSNELFGEAHRIAKRAKAPEIPCVPIFFTAGRQGNGRKNARRIIIFLFVKCPGLNSGSISLLKIGETFGRTIEKN
jgi:hypothetical protein